MFKPSSGGCSSMVEPQPSKLVTWVRFPSPAPPEKRLALFLRGNDAGRFFALLIFSTEARIPLFPMPHVGLSNILDSKGREDISGSSPVKRTHGAGVAATLVGS